MQQRYYDPLCGCFLSTDPVTAIKGPFNRYWHANSNPYKFRDPDGRKVVFADGVSDDFKKNFAKAIKYLNGKGAAANFAKLQASKTTYTVNRQPIERMGSKLSIPAKPSLGLIKAGSK